jgi:hypothetical protein
MGWPIDSHFARRAAIVPAVGLMLAVAIPDANAFDPYIVDRLAISADADSAVAAKDEALSKAVSEGLSRVLKRITRAVDRTALPAPGQTMAERLLDRLSIESERVGPTSYAAEFRVAFSPVAVRGFLRRHGAAVIDRPAPPILIIPVHEHDGIPLWWEAAEEWAEALRAVAFEDGLTPARLPDNTPADRRASRERLSAAERVTLGDFRVRHGVQGVVVALARTVPGRDRVTLSLTGEDATGRIEITEELTSGGLSAAAQGLADTLSERWKATVGVAPAEQGSELSAFSVRILLHDGEREWARIQRRLTASGVISGLAVEHSNSRGIDVTIWHGGGREELAERLYRHGFDLFEAGGIWLLQSY